MNAEEMLHVYGMASVIAIVVSAIIIDYFNQPK
jgi:hypothetical protein